MSDGTNYLRRIRFSEEYFGGHAWAAQTWWADNCDRIVDLYSVVVQPDHPSHDDDDPAAPVTPCQSEDDEHQRQDGIGDLEYSAWCSASASGGSTSNFSGLSSGSGSANKVDFPVLGLVTEADSITRTARAQQCAAQTYSNGTRTVTPRYLFIHLTPLLLTVFTMLNHVSS
ncbi:unnamed protein product [Miscanthus lutarioriparius]|uniref:BRX domain-containing protein n=1 Tax=Miscanthus lutarioriparius TaxID=422564 RepID=A0A811S1K6_9POAL|nr:unnamed protein product [Miscanthus lutarioriparius]